MTLLQQTIKVFMKEFYQEQNSKYFLNSVFMFSFLLIVILIFPFTNLEVNDETKNILFWVIVYFSSVLGYHGIFVKETDRKTVIHLKAHFNVNAIFWGKAIFNILLMYFVISVILIIYSMFFYFEVLLETSIFSSLFFIVVALGINGTLMSSLISFSKDNSTLFAIIGFPIIFPVFMIGINSTQELIFAGAISTMSWVSIGIYVLLSILISYIIFEYIWEHIT